MVTAAAAATAWQYAVVIVVSIAENV